MGKRLNGLTFSKDSKIDALAMYELIKKHSSLPNVIKDAFKLKINPPRLILKDIHAPDNWQELYNALRIAINHGNWEITTGLSERVIGSSGQIGYKIIPDIVEIKDMPGFRVSVTKDKISDDLKFEKVQVWNSTTQILEKSPILGETYPPEGSFSTVNQQEVIARAMRNDPPNGERDNGKKGLIAIADLIKYSDGKIYNLMKSKKSRDEIVLTFFHELCLHAGQIEQGKVYDHKKADVYLDILDIRLNNYLNNLPLSEIISSIQEAEQKGQENELEEKFDFLLKFIKSIPNYFNEVTDFLKDKFGAMQKRSLDRIVENILNEQKYNDLHNLMIENALKTFINTRGYSNLTGKYKHKTIKVTKAKETKKVFANSRLIKPESTEKRRTAIIRTKNKLDNFDINKFVKKNQEQGDEAHKISISSSRVLSSGNSSFNFGPIRRRILPKEQQFDYSTHTKTNIGVKIIQKTKITGGPLLPDVGTKIIDTTGLYITRKCFEPKSRSNNVYKGFFKDLNNAPYSDWRNQQTIDMLDSTRSSNKRGGINEGFLSS